jgi:hypothetical protein
MIFFTLKLQSKWKKAENNFFGSATLFFYYFYSVPKSWNLSTLIWILQRRLFFWFVLFDYSSATQNSNDVQSLKEPTSFTFLDERNFLFKIL